VLPGDSMAQVKGGICQEKHIAYGMVKAARAAVITAPFNLTVGETVVEPGQRVDKGAVLMTFSAPALEALLRNWCHEKRSLSLARRSLSLLEKQKDRALATRHEVLKASMEVERAGAGLASARSSLFEVLHELGMEPETDLPEDVCTQNKDDFFHSIGKLSMVTAPFAGVVTERDIATGMNVSAGSRLFVIKDMEHMFVEVEVPSSEIRLWQQGKAYVLLPQSMPVRLEYRGDVPLLDPATGLLRLRFEAENRRFFLQDGQWVSAEVKLEGRSCFLVPVKAVVSRNGHQYCIVLKGDEMRAQRVKTAGSEGGCAFILDGLHPGDKVLVKGAYEVLYRDLNKLMKFED